MNEQLKILEMIQNGQITAAEGMELLEALKGSKEIEPVHSIEVIQHSNKRSYKYLKIKVTADNNSVNVNVNVPIRLLTTIGEMTGKIITVIPNDARKEMEAKGVDLTSIDFGKIIEDILSGTLDDPNIVDVEAWDDEHNTMVKVKIYVD
ncbi:SHOCT-like domain-containing protein [Anaeromicropila herbilytica]|uniref:YvlB/LiaX N-terminal domain-containing protein n=1 Tax=Anaeromicropila herbilytica TaxID=2785025 RepID=A0A7R7EJ56_9FIRM|nr:hypothetical protein [Anaeromicropila herbilytica]BCN29402.1 hypothetical protein bsdtb5_06970 [Anaeromicropila herbilytica]